MVRGPLFFNDAIAELSTNFKGVIECSISPYRNIYATAKFKQLHTSPDKVFLCCFLKNTRLEIGFYTAGPNAYSPKELNVFEYDLDVTPKTGEDIEALRPYFTETVTELKREFETASRVFMAYLKEIEYWKTRIEETEAELSKIEV